jgi:drug/metabolite transporter (DMT)-like permease
LAFLIQIRTQKILEPTTASMLFLLEGIFALVFGVIFYSEILRPVQFVGVALILVGAALQVREARA